jgi:hypothetical protein
VIHPHVHGEYTYQVGFLLANFVIHPHGSEEYVISFAVSSTDCDLPPQVWGILNTKLFVVFKGNDSPPYQWGI